MRSAVLILSALWAVTAPQHSRSIRAYLRAQLASAVLLEGVLAVGIGSDSPAYAVLFSLATLAILAAAAAVAWECIGMYGGKMRLVILLESCMVPLMILGVAALTLHRQLGTIPSYLWIALLEGALLAALGLAIATAAPLASGRTRLVAIALGVLWLCQACYEYGFALGLKFHPETWLTLNEWLPTFLVATALSWLGWKLRAQEHTISDV